MNNLFRELQRRNVIRVAAAYLVVSWIVMQVVDVIGEAAHMPDWANSFALIILIVGLPVVLFIAWAFELTPEGMRKTAAVPAEISQTEKTGQILNIAILVAIILLVAIMAWRGFAPDNGAIQNAADSEAPLTADLAIDEAPASTASVAAVAGPPNRSIAVLPFMALSSNEDDVYFADGLTEEILNSLAYVPDLLVTSRTSSFQFRGLDLPSIPEIAGQLGVANILEGSVRLNRAGDQARITAQLIRASDDAHLWSQTYDRPLEDIFAIQEEIAESIAGVLGVALDDAARERMASVGTDNLEAFVAFQQGASLFATAHADGYSDELLEQANQFFAEATQHDPGFARAYYLASDRYAHILLNIGGQGVDWDLAAHDEALQNYAGFLNLAESSSNDPEFRNFAQIDRLYLSENWTGAGIMLDRVNVDGRCQRYQWLPELSLLSGRAERIAEMLDRWIACDPLSRTTWAAAQRVHTAAGNYERSLEIVEHLASMDSNVGALAFDRLNLQLVLNRHEESLQLLDDLSAPEFQIQYYNGVAAAQAGDTSVVEEILADIIERDRIEAELGNFMFLAAASGQRHLSSEYVARMDERPLGHHGLIGFVLFCMCGAPWDIEATPNFAARLEEANFPWPPFGSDRFPANRELD